MTRFNSSVCNDFFEHWKSLRTSNRQQPNQTEFLSNLHPSFASRLYITELMDGEMIIRFMGAALIESWGRDKTDEILGKDQPVNFRVAMFTNSRLAISTPCGLHGTVLMETRDGSSVEIEALSLPLTHEHGKPDRLAAYCHVQNKPKQGQANGTYTTFPGTTWVDVGAGVPSIPTLSDGV